MTLNLSTKLFIHKFQPLLLDDFKMNQELIQILKTLILMDSLNLLLIGNTASGKTSLLNALVREYYYGYTPKEYNENIMYINSLKEQGIGFYRNEVKTLCQTCSQIKS
jgi:predicted GTPase